MNESKQDSASTQGACSLHEVDMPRHQCRERRGCTCYTGALSPADKCPQHGNDWRPRCSCGRWVRHIARICDDGEGRA